MRREAWLHQAPEGDNRRAYRHDPSQVLKRLIGCEEKHRQAAEKPRDAYRQPPHAASPHHVPS